MSVEACYVVRFGDVAFPASLQNGGVAVLDSQKIYGGDSGFAYLGDYSTAGDHLTCHVRIIRHDVAAQSVYPDNPDRCEVNLLLTKIGEGRYHGKASRQGFPDFPVALMHLEALP